MDLLVPKIVKIGQRQYRINSTNPPPDFRVKTHSNVISNRLNEEDAEDDFSCQLSAQNTLTNLHTFIECEPEIESESGRFQMAPIIEGENPDEIPEDIVDQLEINKNSCGRFQLEIAVPNAFYGFIIGRRGEGIRRLQAETKCQIHLPRGNPSNCPRSESKNVLVSADKRENVVCCHSRLIQLMQEVRSKIPFTHFVSFPLACGTESLSQRFKDWRSLILEKCEGDRGVDENLFPFPRRLHLTVCMLQLFSQEDVAAASRILGEELDKIELEPILASDCIEYMNDDPTDVNVVYLKLKPDNAVNQLQDFCEAVNNRMIDGKLTYSQYDSVRLHITLLKSSNSNSFNASNIFRVSQNFDFGPVELSEVHISIRYTSDESNGYYANCFRRKLKA